ncbi:MAG: YaeQ family protein [Gemmatimonadetes bacterium]|nr:YaeQ family protein [Gemmatimonadota bacterium]
MKPLALLWTALAAAAVAGTSPGTVSAFQQAPPVRLVAFTNEPREPEFGRVFELYLTLRFAPGIVAFVPDTLIPDQHSFSAGRGTWTSAAGLADSVDVQATYPVMGFLTGGIQLPWLEVWSRPAASGETPGLRGADELARLSDAERSMLQRTLVEIGGALIQVPKEMQGEEASIDPRPPADVLGGNWSAWLVAAMIVSATATLLLAGMFVTSRRAEARSGDLTVALHPREEALRELDRLLALGWHASGRVAEFYDATTGVLRRLSEVQEPEWRRALTSTELVERMHARWGPASVERLRPAIWSAERVKFGGRRPEPKTAEADWSVVRDWIRELPAS